MSDELLESGRSSRRRFVHLLAGLVVGGLGIDALAAPRASAAGAHCCPAQFIQCPNTHCQPVATVMFCVDNCSHRNCCICYDAITDNCVDFGCGVC